MVARSQQFLSPGTYRVGGKMRTLTANDLAEYMTGTVKALDAGLSIPVLSRHAKMGSDEGGPQFSREKSSALDGVGWLIDMKQEPDGSLIHTIDVTDPKALESIDNGSIKFTSPELCEDYTDGKGRNFGRMIRHTALTPTPRNPDQGEFTEAVAAQFSQFSMDDFVGEQDQQFDHILTDDPVDAPEVKAASKTIAHALLESVGAFFPSEVDPNLSEADLDRLVAAAEVIEKMKEKANAAQRAAEKSGDLDSTTVAFAEDDSKKKKSFPPEASSRESDSDSVPEGNPTAPVEETSNSDEPKNPDMPAVDKSRQKSEAIVAQLESLGVALPADFSFDNEAALDILLSGLKTASLAKENAEIENKEPDEDVTVREEPNIMGQQFTEEIIAGMSPIEKATHERLVAAETKLTQMSEDRTTERTSHSQAKLIAKIKTSAIPPGMKTKMMSQVTSVQFSEDGDEQTHYTASQVIDLFAEFIPRNLQFKESETTEVEHPKGHTENSEIGGLHVDDAKAKEISDGNTSQWEALGMKYEHPNGPSGVGMGRAPRVNAEATVPGW